MAELRIALSLGAPESSVDAAFRKHIHPPRFSMHLYDTSLAAHSDVPDARTSDPNTDAPPVAATRRDAPSCIAGAPVARRSASLELQSREPTAMATSARCRDPSVDAAASNPVAPPAAYSDEVGLHACGSKWREHRAPGRPLWAHTALVWLATLGAGYWLMVRPHH